MKLVRAMKVVHAAAMLLVTVATGFGAETTDDWSNQPKAAFMETYVFACQPVEYDFAGARDPLRPVALEIYEQVFVVKYDSDCRDFYFEEVVPRLDLDLRPHIPG